MWLKARWARQIEYFWEQAGGPEPFPRSLLRAAPLALPLSAHEEPRLSLASAREWLASRGVDFSPGGPDRPLRGCLVAYAGYGFVLVDALDTPDERRFTAAHEIAHFMADYRLPRLDAIDALGEEIVPVLDGVRPPTTRERAHAILGRVPLGTHVNLMDRTHSGSYTNLDTLDAEQRADRIALELLAPVGEAWPAIEALPAAGPGGSFPALRQAAAGLLVERYGLPAAEAATYARWLLRKAGRKPGFREWLG